MTTATALLYHAAGAPPMPGAAAGLCRLCGLTAVGLPFAAWVKETFTDWDKLQPGEIICHACQFAVAEASALLAARVGKDKPQRMRNYSHFVVNGAWLPLSKGNKQGQIDALIGQGHLATPQVAVVAISGQKHLVFRARPGWWQIEEQTVRPFPDQLRALLALVGELYAGGISKAEIETGRYISRRIIEFGLPRWRALEDQIKPLRGSLPLQLALFLVQKEDTDDGDTDATGDDAGPIAGHLRDGARPARADLARHPQRVQSEVRPQNLAAIRGQRQERGLHEQPQQVRQHSLFEVADDAQDG